MSRPPASTSKSAARCGSSCARSTNSGTTIILTTHYLEEAENLCRHIAIIDEGRIIEHDRMSNVIRKLQTEIFVFNLRNSIAALPDLPGYGVKLTDDHTLEIEVDREQNLNEIFARLSQSGIEVLSMRNKVNRLEDFFMRLVEGEAATDRARHE